MRKKKQSKSSSNLFLIILILIMLFAYFIFLVQYKRTPYRANKKNGTGTSITPDQQQFTNAYQVGKEINKHKFSIIDTSEWQITIQKDNNMIPYSNNIIERINFHVRPTSYVLNEGQKVWGAFTVDIFPPSSSIENWFMKFLSTPVNGINNNMNNKEYYAYSEIQIGNKTGYLIKAAEGAPEYIKESFVPRYIVVGKYYLYQIVFSQNGVQGSAERIENELFPKFNFE